MSGKWWMIEGAMAINDESLNYKSIEAERLNKEMKEAKTLEEIVQIADDASCLDMEVQLEKVSGEIVWIHDTDESREWWEETLTDIREITVLERDWFEREVELGYYQYAETREEAERLAKKNLYKPVVFGEVSLKGI